MRYVRKRDEVARSHVYTRGRLVLVSAVSVVRTVLGGHSFDTARLRMINHTYAHT